MDFDNFIEKLKEIKEAIKQDAHEGPSYEDMNRDRDEYFLLMAIEQYLEHNDSCTTTQKYDTIAFHSLD